MSAQLRLKGELMMKAIRTIGLLLLAVLLALPCAALADYSMPVADGDLDVFAMGE